MTEDFNNAQQEQIIRPQGLTTLCILSFIGSGMSLFANIFLFLFYDSFMAILTSDEMEEVPMAFDAELLSDFANTAGQFYFLLSTVLYAMSILGVYYMWHLIKKGIHLYAIAQLTLILLPLLFIDSNLSVIPGLLLSGAFVLLYSKYLKIMR
ncbi:MAG: hypothetical protein KAH25_01315 [Bacteroidales bacterium]|nr:hypothetical protein [Bacteroidales bacterium]